MSKAHSRYGRGGAKGGGVGGGVGGASGRTSSKAAPVVLNRAATAAKLAQQGQIVGGGGKK